MLDQSVTQHENKGVTTIQKIPGTLWDVQFFICATFRQCFGEEQGHSQQKFQRQSPTLVRR